MEKDILNIMQSSRPCLSPSEVSQYLKNELSEDDRFDIENHLLDCKLCATAVEGYAATNAEIPEVNINELRAGMKSKQTEENKIPEAKVVPMRKRINWAVAAGLIFLLSIAGYNYYQARSGQNLYANYYEPYDKALLATRSATDIDNPDLSNGLAAFEKGNYMESLSLLEKAKTADPENGAIALYAGMAAMEAEVYDKAGPWLSEARINHLASYATATWYLALNHLAQKDYPNCRNLLKQLGPDDSPYYEKAQKLLNRLNK